MRFKNILSYLANKFNLKKKEEPSLEKALSVLLTRRQFQRLIEAGPDRRSLVQKAAFEISTLEVELAIEVARVLGLPFLQRVRAVDTAVLPVGMSIQDCYQAGCIPLVANRVISGVACTDPDAARSLFKNHLTIPFFISLWTNIENALDQSVIYQNERLLEDERIQKDRINQMAKKALAIIVNEAERHNNLSIDLIFSGPSPRYKLNIDGQTAFGEINEKLKESLLNILRSSSMIAIELPNGDFYNLSCASIKGESAENFRVSWREALKLVKSETTSKDLDPAVTCLPEAKEERLSSEIFSASSTDNYQNHSIIVVDDNLIFARVLERFFAKYNITVTHFPNGLEALNSLSSQQKLPDLVVCDVHMPEMNGFEFIKRLRSDTRMEDLPLVMLTSDGDVETELRLLNDGADAFITKNQDPRLLCVKVRKLIEKNTRKKAA